MDHNTERFAKDPEAVKMYRLVTDFFLIELKLDFVTKEEIERHLYQPLPEEWRGLDSKSECLRIARGLEQLMALAHAENFNYPVDLTAFPDYMLEIEYPMDFSLIKSRLDNQFYRRLTAVQFDVRYIATNAECYNRPKTEIVKCARVLTDLVLLLLSLFDHQSVNLFICQYVCLATCASVCPAIKTFDH